MWTGVKNESRTVSSDGNNTKMDDPDLLTRQVSHTVQRQNGSTATAMQPSYTEESLTRNGIIPGAIAASVFIAFLLVLYAVLWKCMVSPPQRKHRKVRVRVPQKTSV